MKSATQPHDRSVALRRLRQFRRQGQAFLHSESIDQYCYGRWCQRVARALPTLFRPPLDYSNLTSPNIERLRSPLALLGNAQPPLSAEAAQALRDRQSKRVVARWLLALASAIERMELYLEANT